jgi:hypothetical protein
MNVPGYPDALRVLREVAGGDLKHMLAAACASIPAWDPAVYLGDFSGNVLLPLAVGADSEMIAGSMAGRAFSTGQPVTAGQQDRRAGGHGAAPERRDPGAR